MPFTGPSVAALLPEKNKTTAEADNAASLSVAFLMARRDVDLGAKPPPGDAWKTKHMLESLMKDIGGSGTDAPQAVPKQQLPSSKHAALEPLFKSLGVHCLKDGGMESVQEFAMTAIAEDNLQDNFYTVDLGRLERLHEAFVQCMPRVHPYYAVKCNPDPGIMKVLAALGCGFDCASAQEMADVIAMGVPRERIIFAHPCKRPCDLEYAAAANVQRMTFDSEDELEKIAELAPDAKLVLRIKADDPSAVVQFGHKYGAHPRDDAPGLFAAAKRLGLDVVGVSFHVGSGSQCSQAYHNAIGAAKYAFEAGRAEGFAMELLDLGGGFWGRFDLEGTVPLANVAAAINDALAAFFPASEGVHVIAEPGRYFAESTATMFSLVHTVKQKLDPATGKAAHRSYFITDGVYGSFNGLIYDHGSVTAKILRGPGVPAPTAEQQCTLVPSTVFGPTCDGVDLIYKNVPMPALRRGDWLQFPNYGAYSLAGACPFNGMQVHAPTKYYVHSAEPLGPWERTVEVIRRGDERKFAHAPEHHLCFVGDVHDLDILC